MHYVEKASVNRVIIISIRGVYQGYLGVMADKRYNIERANI